MWKLPHQGEAQSGSCRQKPRKKDLLLHHLQEHLMEQGGRGIFACLDGFKEVTLQIGKLVIHLLLKVFDVCVGKLLI
jgi:hypothetical protein